MVVCFAEMYGTCLRRKPPRKGLNSFYDNFSIELKKLYLTKEEKNKDEFNNLFNRVSSFPITNNFEEIIMDYIKIISQQVKEIKKTLEFLEFNFRLKREKNPLIPKEILDSLIFTIDYRNKVSHRSEEQVSNSEVSLSMMGVIRLMIWWEYIKRGIKDYDKDKLKILNELILESIKFTQDKDFCKRFFHP